MKSPAHPMVFPLASLVALALRAGLSIVKAVADAHHATVSLGASSLGGLLAEVHLTAAPPARPGAGPAP